MTQEEKTFILDRLDYCTGLAYHSEDSKRKIHLGSVLELERILLRFGYGEEIPADTYKAIQKMLSE